MRGHEEASGTKYVPQDLMDSWAKKDPISNFETFLIEEGILTEEKIESIRDQFKQEINEGLDVAYNQPKISSSDEQELEDVYAPFTQKNRSTQKSKSH